MTSLSHIGEGNGNPLQCSCLENPRDGGTWWAAVAQSQTRLKRLSSSSSSSYKSLQCLISTLTQRGKGGHLFRLTCSVVLWGGRNTANKYHWRVWGVLTVYGPQWICPSSWRHVLSWSTLLRFQVAQQGHCPKRTLCFVHFPGLSCSGSGSRVLHRSTDLVGHAFCALPRSKWLTRCVACTLSQVGRAS